MQIFIIGGIIAIMIAITIFNIIFLKKGQEADKKFREENPDISTIKFHASSHIVSSATTVYTVDEKIPQYSKASFKG